MNKLIFIFLGGGAGALSRFGLSTLANGWIKNKYPIGTLLVNTIGSFLMGLLFSFFKHNTNFSQELKVFLLIGFLGAFTTFSTYSLETINLFKDNKILPSVINIITNNTLCFIFAALGIFIMTKKS